MKHMIQRQGRTHVLWPGLLNEVHERFRIWDIDTELIQIPVEGGNGTGEQFAIVKARFEGINHDGDTIKTSGIATAGRKSDLKARDTQPAKDAPIEMAETRAKGRALRDAVNVGEAVAEEMPPESEASEPNEASEVSPIQRGQATRANPPRNPKTKESEAFVKPETLRQLRFHSDTFAEEVRQADPKQYWDAFVTNLEAPLEYMREGEAQRWIGRFKSGLAKAEKESK